MNWGHPERRKILLLIGDLFVIVVAASASMMIHPGHSVTASQRAGAVVLLALAFPACFYVFDLYDLSALTRLRTACRLLTAGVLGSCVASFFLYFAQWLGASRGSMAIAVPAVVATCYGWRRFYVRNARIFAEHWPVLLIGPPNIARQLGADLIARDSNYAFLGFLRNEGRTPTLTEPLAVVPELELVPHGHAGLQVGEGGAAFQPAARIEPPGYLPASACDAGVADLGPLSADRLQEIVWQWGIHTVVIHSDTVPTGLAPCLTRLRFHGVRIARIPDFYNQLSEELPLDALSDSWLSFADGFYLVQARFFRRLKRLSDIVLALAGLALSLPISVLAVLAIKVDSPGPALFRQWRVGWMERPFKLLKFRSMSQDAEPGGRPQWASLDDPRITRVGRILRKLHIDEIPQMINVLFGDMSFVGPRPERPVFVRELKSQIPFYDLRHSVPPGITGWAQVNYRYGASVEDARRKLQFDLYYIRNASFAMDLRIILRTVRRILVQRGNR